MRQAWVAEDVAHQRAVPAHDQPIRRSARQDPQGVLGHGPHELVGLVAPTAREPLLGPATGRGPGLHVPGPALVLGELAPVSQPHGVPAPADQDKAQRVVREGRAHGCGAIPAHGTDDGALLGEVGAVVSLGEAVQPAAGPLWADLEPSGHRLKPSALSCSRPSSVILSGPHGGIQTQLTR